MEPSPAKITINEPKQLNTTPRPNSSAKADEADGARNVPVASINYKNGRKIEPTIVSYENYLNHREKLPNHYHPLVQYLEKTELKYHNDNLYEASPIGFPTRGQILRERVYHLPIIKSTPAEKARYRRKLEETQTNVIMARKKYDFKTYDNRSSHYFLTGGRFNRNDTIDSKMLNKYGVFVNRHNPESVYIKSSQRAIENYKQDVERMKTFANLHNQEPSLYEDKSSQVKPWLINQSI